MSNIKLHLVSHVHWDPMWYLSFEEYRIRLVKLMKKLLNILDTEHEYTSFMFDGQLSAIDDYLEIIPCDEKRIKRHVKDGRLIIGPWYIQPEEFMISGESHIRNLQLGYKRGKELGGVMNISYLCDMVGHIPQMPQIIKGFDLDTFVAARGIINGKELMKTEFIWKSPDGSKILCKVMPFGYQNIIPSDADGFISHVKKIKRDLQSYATTSYILVMQGGDHLEPLPNVPQLIREYNKVIGSDELVHTSLQEHINAIKDAKSTLVEYSGELRSTTHSFILTGILTDRMEIKLANEKITRDIEKWIEPFCSIDTILLQREYPEHYIDYVWKKQLKNAFHDCIYGAHADHVTPDILNDYKRANEVIHWIIGESLWSISSNINTISKDINITIFNPSAWSRENYIVDFEIFLKDNKIRKEFEVKDTEGNTLSSQLLEIKKVQRFTGYSENMWTQNFGTDGYLYLFSVKVPYIPALGYCNISIERNDWDLLEEREKHISNSKALGMATDLLILSNGFENKYLRVEIKEDGLLNILDKENQKWYYDMHTFEDRGDAGDQYNYSSPVKDQKIINKGRRADIRLVESGPVKATYRIQVDMKLPKCIEENYTRSSEDIVNQITSYITLKQESRIVEFRTIINNQSRDHRLRLFFPTRLCCSESSAGSQFYVVNRSTEVPEPPTYAEKPLGNYPHRLFVDVSDGQKGVSFLDRGLPEYSLTPDGELHITLLRCTGYLSKDNLLERSYRHAGPGLPTPAAQEIGEHTFEYALYFHSGDWKEGKCYKYSQEFYASLKTIQGDAHVGSLPSMLSFINIDNDCIVLSSLKRSYLDNKWIIRVFNTSEVDANTKIGLFKPIVNAWRVNLKEEILSKIDVVNDSISIQVKPYEIFTMAVEL